MNRIHILISMLVILSSNTVSSSIIDTATDWDGASGIGGFGSRGFTTAGQTFIAPGTDTYLESWTFFIAEEYGVAAFEFYLMDWDSKSGGFTGPILYQSTMVSTSNNGGLGGYESFTFNTGGVSLESGNDYIAFISTARISDGLYHPAIFGWAVYDNPYVDGDFIMSEGDWTSADWIGHLVDDAAFIATFSSIPEPNSVCMILLGGGALYFRKRSRKDQKISISQSEQPFAEKF